ncbi:MAG: Ig-like domain-containing protein [Elusimicrobiota bacterium]|nr:Ig-like domain-containing protein [Elusimicrobiota bacterium]
MAATALRQPVLRLRATGDILVAAGAVLDATGRGYPAGTGTPSGPGAGVIRGGGGGHGGFGGGGQDSTAYGQAYDDMLDPTQPGSSGAGNPSSSRPGGDGGGVVILQASGLLRMNGTVSVDGTTPQDFTGAAVGGGAGGSIQLRAAVLEGTGSLTARGGNGNFSVSAPGGGGGGGRILIEAAEDRSTLALDASGGRAPRDNGSGFNAHGGAGTIVRKSSGPTIGELRLRNAHGFAVRTPTPVSVPVSVGTLTVTAAVIASSGVPQPVDVLSSLALTAPYGVYASSLTFPPVSSFTIPSRSTVSVSFISVPPGSDWSIAGSLFIPALSAGSLSLSGVLRADSVSATSLSLGVADLEASTLTVVQGTAFVLPAGARLKALRAYLPPGADWSIGGSLLIGDPLLAGTVSVLPSARISPPAALVPIDIRASGDMSVSAGAQFLAAAMGHSVRGGGPGAGCAGGGGAGHGGRGGFGGCLVFGAVYDDPIAPVEFGSAGGGEFSPINVGGAGGGLVLLRSSGVLTMNGLIDASGQTAFHASGFRAGGGSGGSIDLRAHELRGVGTLRADGGGGNVGPGGGGTESGGGGGGRIAVEAAVHASSFVFSVAGGLKGRPTQSSGGPTDGEPGTVVRLPILVASQDGSASLASHVFGSSVTAVSTGTAPAAYSVAVATQGLFSLSPFYEITPSPIVFDPPATFSIEFDPAGVDPGSVAIYFFDGVNWTSAAVAGQTVEFLPDGRARALGTLSHASLYALFARDVTPPLLSLLPPSGSTLTTTTPAILMSFSDAGGGVSTDTLRLFVDGSDATSALVVSAASASFVPSAALAQGTHSATAQVADRAGNLATAQTNFLIDSLPPVTRLLVNGLPAGSTVLTVLSTDFLGFDAIDSGVGVAETRYTLDGVEFVFSSTFSLAVGTHAIAYFSADVAGNTEPASSAAFTVLTPDGEAPLLALLPVHGSTLATTTPQLVASYSDPGRGVDLASVRLFLDAVEVTSWATVNASSAVFSPAALAEGTHTFSASVADLAGNAAAASSTFLVDTVPPLTTLLVDGSVVATTHAVISSTSGISLAAVDTGSGVLETLYSVDGSSPALFVSPFSLAAGLRSVAFQSRDRAGNLEPLRGVTLDVVSPSADNVAPVVRLDFPGSAALEVEQAVGGVVAVRGAVSDESAVTWTLEAAPGASASSGFSTIASGAGNLSGLIASWNTAGLSGRQTLRLRAVDAFGNAAAATAVVFVGAPVFNFAIGRKDSNVIVSTLKGPTGIAARADGALWVASTENDQVLLISPSGVLLGSAGHAPGNSGDDDKGKKDKTKDDDDDDDDAPAAGLSFKSPQGLALDGAENLYVADKGLDRVLKLSRDGRSVLLALGRVDNKGKPKSGSGIGEFKDPWDVAVDGNGDIYVADSGNRRIQVFDSSGTFLRQFGQGVFGGESDIRGIALTAEGLWVSDKEDKAIHLFSRAGALLKSIGDADSVVGEISRMRGVASDHMGALYVIEPNRDRTQKFDPQGKGLLAFGSKDGLSKADKHAKRYLTQPIDAAIAPDGSIWITDTGRDRIVRYALPATGGFGVASQGTGGGFTSSSVEPAKRLVDHKDGAKVERDDGAGVNVPKGALSADLEITVDKADENEDKEHKDAKRAEKKVAAVSEEVQYGPEGTAFSVPVTLTIPYDAALVASQGIKEDELKVYYWNPSLKDWQAMPSVVDKANKTVNAQTTHFSAYQVQGPGGGGIGVAAVDDFSLRDAYVFPNPSRNGSAVTFRIQPGRADSVEVRVYDLAGRRVHSSSDFRFLGAIDDGNGKGAQNTYDHVWGVSGVGSGVYYFVITAKRAGESEIRKTGKVAVIR